MKYILDLCPGDSMDIRFPEGFTVDYETSILEDGEFIKKIETSVCTRMHAYFWDDDDHRCLDFYFYNDNISNSSWFAKQYYLTPESWKKVEEFVKDNYKK